MADHAREGRREERAARAPCAAPVERNTRAANSVSGLVHCHEGEGQIILPVACSFGQTTTGSPFCIWWV